MKAKRAESISPPGSGGKGAMTLRLFTAAMWLLLAAVIFAWEWAHPPDRLGGGILGTQLSLGWVALILGVYNLAYWWSTRSRSAGVSAEQQWQHWRRSRGEGESPHQEPPDPNFNFTDEPKQGDQT